RSAAMSFARCARSRQAPPDVYASMRGECVDEVVGEDASERSVLRINDHQGRAALVHEAIDDVVDLRFRRHRHGPRLPAQLVHGGTGVGDQQLEQADVVDQPALVVDDEYTGQVGLVVEIVGEPSTDVGD